MNDIEFDRAAFAARPDVQAFSAALAAIMAGAKADAAGHVDRQTPLLAEFPKHAREIIEGYVRFKLPHGVYVGGALAQMPDDERSFAEKIQRILSRDDTSWELKYANIAALSRCEPGLAAQYRGAGLNYLRHAMSGARVPDSEDPASPTIKIKRGR